MSSFGSPSPFFLAGKKAYEVERSLRFNDNDSAYLRKSDYGSPDSSTTFTFSAWIKRANLDVWVPIAGSHSGSNAFNVFGINPQNELVWRMRNSSSVDVTRIESANLLRDTSAWYHVLLERNSTLSTAGDRAKLYINGVRVTEFDQNNTDSQNDGYRSDFLQDINIGRYQNNSSSVNYGDLYIAEYHYIDGQAYDPSYFTETDPITGQLIPKKYTGGYGSNGFYLNFSDNSGTTATTLGKDSSGNGNNFTPNNFVTGDAVKDSPTNNFCTYNPLNANKNRGQASFSQGNLRMTSTSGNRGFTTGTIKAQGKIYFEVLNKSNSGFVGIADITGSNHQSLDFYNGTPRIDGSAQSNTGQFSSGDIMGVKVDIDAKSIEFFKNGSSVFSATYTTDVEYFPFIEDPSGGRSTDAIANFGQDSSFAGEKTAQGNTDANGIGDFYYSVPSGYKAICSANLPDPTILLPNKHFGTLLWTGNATVRTISDTSQVNFTPDWVWVKSRSAGHDHQLTDSVRGSSKALAANLSEQEIDWDVLYSGNNKGMGDYVNGGFILDDDGNNARYNQNSQTYVAWNWNAGDTDGKTYAVTVVSDSGNKYRFDGFGTSAVTLDLAEGGTYVFDWSDSSAQSHPIRFSTTSDGTHGGGSEYTTGVTKDDSAYKTTITVAASAPTLYYYCQNHSGMGGAINTNSTLGSSNFDGSIQSVAKVNASAGFSITRYTGTAANATVGHGLGVKPDSVILKRRTGGDSDWMVFHKDLGNTKNIRLNTTSSQYTTSNIWNNTDPTSSAVNIGTSSAVNGNGSTYVMYCFSEVASFSKFGSYTGNGSSDGTFVFTGFKPAFVIFKYASGSAQWNIRDIARDTDNPTEKYLLPSDSGAEGTSSHEIDFLSNGFKHRGTGSAFNSNGGTYIYLAFASSPFKNARAR